MTNSEIIKALECCIRNDLKECKICPYDKLGQGCRRILQNDILDLINRQKAEIEKQKAILEAIDDEMFPLPFETDFDKAIKVTKSEAIKEFAERLKESLEWRTEPIDEYDIDELVKEMTEDENA